MRAGPGLRWARCRGGGSCRRRPACPPDAADRAAVRAGIRDGVLVVLLDRNIVVAAAHGVFQVGVVRIAFTDVGPGQSALRGPAACGAGRVDVPAFANGRVVAIRLRPLMSRLV